MHHRNIAIQDCGTRGSPFRHGPKGSVAEARDNKSFGQSQRPSTGFLQMTTNNHLNGVVHSGTTHEMFKSTLRELSPLMTCDEPNQTLPGPIQLLGSRVAPGVGGAEANDEVPRSWSQTQSKLREKDADVIPRKSTMFPPYSIWTGISMLIKVGLGQVADAQSKGTPGIARHAAGGLSETI